MFSHFRFGGGFAMYEALSQRSGDLTNVERELLGKETIVLHNLLHSGKHYVVDLLPDHIVL